MEPICDEDLCAITGLSLSAVRVLAAYVAVNSPRKMGCVRRSHTLDDIARAAIAAALLKCRYSVVDAAGIVCAIPDDAYPAMLGETQDRYLNLEIIDGRWLVTDDTLFGEITGTSVAAFTPFGHRRRKIEEYAPAELVRMPGAPKGADARSVYSPCSTILQIPATRVVETVVSRLCDLTTKRGTGV